jgi:hypothetical protein
MHSQLPDTAEKSSKSYNYLYSYLEHSLFLLSLSTALSLCVCTLSIVQQCYDALTKVVTACIDNNYC